MSRIAKKISKEEFMNKLSKLHENYKYCSDRKDMHDNIQALIFTSKHVKKDLAKINFYFENTSFDGDSLEDSFYSDKDHGLQQIGALVYFGISAGGDWELPVYFIAYWDGNSFRGYVPEEGNTFNPITRTAYGSEMENEKKLSGLTIDNLIKAYGLKKSEVDLSKIDISDPEDYDKMSDTFEYLYEECQEKDNIKPDWKKIRESIIKRIKVE